jgi:hypothetical protein
MIEERIERLEKVLESGEHEVDEETTKRWLAYEREELATWKRNLSQAVAAAVPVVPLA